MTLQQSSPSRILIVEDSETDAEILKRHLKRWKPDRLHITTATYGRDGLQVLENIPPPELVLLDLDLPDMTGLDFLNSFPSAGKKPAVIIITGSGNESLAVKALQAGAVEYLVKNHLNEHTLRQAIVYALEKRRLQDELNFTRTQLQSLIEHSPMGMGLLDRELNLQQANGVFMEALGMPEATFEQVNLNLLEGGWLQQLRHLCEQVIEQRQRVQRNLLDVSSTEVRQFTVQAYPAAFADNQVQWIGVTLENTTVRRQAEEQAESLHLSQQRFVSDAAHELRNPLTSIQGNLDVLVRYPDIPASDRQDILKEMQTETSQLSRLVSDMLQLARGDSGLQVKSERVELHRVLLQVWQEFQKKQHTHQLELGAVQPAVVQGDAERLCQLLLILLDNAASFTPQGGTIRVSQQNTPQGVRWEVTDTGVGMVEADVSRVFERFFRVDPSRHRNREVGGTGLGLSIAKWIVEQHHGSILVDSTPGEGTQVTLLFPPWEEGTSESN